MFSSKALPPTFASALEFTAQPAFFGIWLSLALSSYWYLDEAIAFYLHQHLPHLITGPLKQISKLGVAGYYVVGFFVFYLIARFILANRYYSQRALFLFSVVSIPGIVCDLIKILLGRYRPRMLFQHDLYGFHFLTLKSKMWSFPSGHSVTIMALMVALSLCYPRRWYLFCLFALFICATRVLICAHYLSDVMVGMWLGVMGALFCSRWFEYSPFLQRYPLMPPEHQRLLVS